MSPILAIIIALICLFLGIFGGYAYFRYVVKGKYNELMVQADKDAEVIKEKKTFRSERKVPQQEERT